jgi:hypothetical protein
MGGKVKSFFYMVGHGQASTSHSRAKTFPPSEKERLQLRDTNTKIARN